MLYYSIKECAIRHINPRFLHSPSNTGCGENPRSKQMSLQPTRLYRHEATERHEPRRNEPPTNLTVLTVGLMRCSFNHILLDWPPKTRKKQHSVQLSSAAMSRLYRADKSLPRWVKLREETERTTKRGFSRDCQRSTDSANLRKTQICPPRNPDRNMNAATERPQRKRAT
jgi:hypothetical protein